MIVEKLGLPEIAEAGRAAILGLMTSARRTADERGDGGTAENNALWVELDMICATASGTAARAAQLHHHAAASLDELGCELSRIAELVASRETA